jgi:hypothetical protein
VTASEQKAHRQTLSPIRAPGTLGDWFRTLTVRLLALPREARAQPAPPWAVRLYNAGYDKFRRIAPELASAPAAPPEAVLNATLGVVLARSGELAELLRDRPAEVPVAAMPTPVKKPRGRPRKK